MNSDFAIVANVTRFHAINAKGHAYFRYLMALREMRTSVRSSVHLHDLISPTQPMVTRERFISDHDTWNFVLYS